MPLLRRQQPLSEHVWRWLACTAILLVLGGSPAWGQALVVEADQVPLPDVLADLAEQADVDLVYADRLIRQHTIICRYRGESLEQAFACILAGTGLYAQRVRRHQYVLVAQPTEAAAPALGTIAGFIVDAETEATLPGAHVYIAGLNLGTTTNLGGYFALPDLPQGTYPVHVSYIGYERRAALIDTDAGAVTIRLQPAPVVSPEVLVEGEEGEETAAQSTLPGLVTLPPEALARLPVFPGEPDLIRALQWVPGVQQVGVFNGGMTVRGGAPNQNLYLIDGAPIYHPWHAFSLISTFQTNTFKDIRLYRGALPAEHGGRLSAVLDAEMKDGSRREPTLNAGLSVLSGRFLIEAPLTKRSSFMISGRRSYLDKLIGDRHPVAGPDGRRDTLRTGYYFYDQSAKLSVRASRKHQFTFSYYHGKDDLDLRLPLELSLDDLSLDFFDDLVPPDLLFEIDQGWSNRLFSARHKYLASSRFFVTTTAYRTSYRGREAALLLPTTESRLESAYAVRLRDTGLRADVDWYPALTHQVRLGVEVVRRHFDSRLRATVERTASAIDTLDQRSRQEAWEAVLYAQDTWQVGRRWHLQPGVRVSVLSGGRFARVSPRLSARYAVWPGIASVRAAAGLQVQYLHQLRDRYSFLYDFVTSRWLPASADVQPAHSVQLSAGAEAQPLPWLTLEVDTYWHETRHVLVPADVFQRKDGVEGPGVVTGALLGQYAVGRGRQYGLEGRAQAERGPWQVWLSYAGGRSLSRSPELGEGAYRPSEFDVPRAFRGLVGYRPGPWSVSVSSEMRSGYPQTVPVARYDIDDPLAEAPTSYLHRPDINNGRLPPYVRFDVALGYAFDLAGGSWEARLQLYNVLNRRNVLERRYDPQATGVVVEDRYGLGLLPYLELALDL